MISNVLKCAKCSDSVAISYSGNWFVLALRQEEVIKRREREGEEKRET